MGLVRNFVHKVRRGEKMEVAEMRMLKWICGVRRRERIRNKLIRGTTKVTNTNKITGKEITMQWYDHVIYGGIRNMGVDDDEHG
jgi:hypothetical protein